jgi:dTDP-4-amino-4,6-dideoxygalactose transaminase
VEDAAQAHGATYRGRRAGSFGPAGFSLYATKNMTTGEGGFVTTDDDALAEWLRRYRNQGMRARYEFEMLGFNYRMTDIAAAIGLVQLDKLDRNNARRRAVAAAYDDGLRDLGVGLPTIPGDREHVFHHYTVRIGARRDAVLADLRANGVGADVYYPLPVHRQPYLAELVASVDLPETDRAAAETLALPIHGGLTDDEVTTVIEAMRRALA